MLVSRQTRVIEIGQRPNSCSIMLFGGYPIPQQRISIHLTEPMPNGKLISLTHHVNEISSMWITGYRKGQCTSNRYMSEDDQPTKNNHFRNYFFFLCITLEFEILSKEKRLQITVKKYTSVSYESCLALRWILPTKHM